MLKRYGIPAREAELDSRLERARAWLPGAEAETNDNHKTQHAQCGAALMECNGGSSLSTLLVSQFVR